MSSQYFSLDQRTISDLYNRHKKSAARKKLQWSITRADIEGLYLRSGGKCAVTGLTFNLTAVIRSSKKRPFAPSVDRIDSRHGYTKANCRLVCIAANYAMNEWGESVLVKMAEAMRDTGKIPPTH